MDYRQPCWNKEFFSNDDYKWKIIPGRLFGGGSEAVWGRALPLGLGKGPLTNGGFRKLTEVSVNERQKPLIFKMLTEQISRFKKN